MELDFLPKVEKFFRKFPPGSEVGAHYFALCEDVAEQVPPSAYPGMDRLHGKSLRDVFYLHCYENKRSDRVYFYCEKDTLYVLLILENKRRTELTKGQSEQIENALKEARRRAKGKP